MKKKLIRDSFSALRETAIVLDEQEQRAVKGGDYFDDHGYYTTDSSGNLTWTRTVNDSSSGSYSSGSDGYGSSSGSGWISQDAYFNWSGTWTGGYVDGLGYVGADVNIYGSGSGDPYINTVDNGRCIAGVIANALYQYGISYDMQNIINTLRTYETITYIGSYIGQSSSSYQVVYSTNDNDIHSILSSYFDICYESSVYRRVTEIERGAMAYVELKGSINHAVLVTNIDRSDSTFTYLDPVTGETKRLYVNSPEIDRFIILNKK